jgi:hypothetical protein
MRILKPGLAVTCSLVILVTQAVAAQDPTPAATEDGWGHRVTSLADQLVVSWAAELFEDALKDAEAAVTRGWSGPGAIRVTPPPFRCTAIPGAQASAEKLAALYRDPWERALAPVRSQYADLLEMASDRGVARIALAFAERMDRLEQASAVGPSDQLREDIEYYAQDQDWHPAYPIMELVVPLMTIPGIGEGGAPGIDPRNLEALHAWGEHIASDLISQVMSERQYSLIAPIVRLGQVSGEDAGVTPGIADALAEALGFTVKVDLTLTMDDLGYPTKARATLEAADLRLVPGSLVPTSPLAVTFEGDGTITEHGGVIAKGRGTTYSMATLAVPTTVTLTVDPCERITVDASPWGDNESITMTKGARSLTMGYPGTGMWDSAMRTALRRSRAGLGVPVADGEVTLQGAASLGYTEGDTKVKIKADLQVTPVGDEPASDE